ncbi:YkyB family protein [Fictibacillus sp. KU28468]|uniref:YkyB family protein n=1 Tax=Fictibacillus sp. KU28468 TaxID=2991053 RepID=UPI00223CB093|nr:YkyB family protein [Fictibacillus sp. KU28468]UZJ79352.1 YkyB family protein [Fictibacillus sp. KU28468]
MKTKTQEIAKAIYMINKHAKNAPALYSMKERALHRLLREGKAEKIGLNYSPNPGKALQRLDVLVKVEDFLFHLPSTKDDRKNLEILTYDSDYRNPKVSMPLKQAKQILETYSPLPKPPAVKRSRPKQRPKYIGISTYLNGTSK